MELKDLGFDQGFETQSAAFAQAGCGFARVVAVDRGACVIRNALREVPAELTGRFAYHIENTSDMPCVGDWVAARYYNDGAAAIIHQVFPRKTFLRRKTAGDPIDLQMIAANIDTAFIVQSCHFDFNPRRLERYLVMAADGGVDPVIVLTKTDLITPEELDQQLAAVGVLTKAGAIAFSTITGNGFDAFQQLLSPGKTYCLLGSSGVGKTTIINRLMGRDAFETKAVSATGEGTHTTSRRQLIVLGQGAMLIDTPGMRELGLVGAGDGISIGFEDILALAAGCRFADCSHEHEAGCAVLDALAKGELGADRFAGYRKLKKESAFHELSYLDRRKKDKTFGKFIKAVKKQIKD